MSHSKKLKYPMRVVGRSGRIGIRCTRRRLDGMKCGFVLDKQFKHGPGRGRGRFPVIGSLKIHRQSHVFKPLLSHGRRNARRCAGSAARLALSPLSGMQRYREAFLTKPCSTVRWCKVSTASHRIRGLTAPAHRANVTPWVTKQRPPNRSGTAPRG